MSVYLYRLARWSFRHRRRVLAAWFAVVIAVVLIAKLWGGTTNDTFTIPGTESQQASEVLQADIPAAAGASTQVVFETNGDITSSADKSAVEAAVADLTKVPQVTSVSDPYRSGSISKDNQVALATVSYAGQAADVDASTVDDLRPAVAQAESAGINVEFGGAVYPAPDKSETTELIGILAALAILVVVFGSMLVGGVPIATALFGVVISLMGLTIVAAFTDVASAATSVGLMLGISCGIDYGLFIVSRHRQHVLAGLEPDDAVGRAAGTAGSSVVFAGLSVIAALCGLAVVGIPFLTVMGLAAAGAVLLALLIAMTLLPAALGFAGHRVGRFSRLPLLRRAGPSTRTAIERPEELKGSAWTRWVVRHRILVLITGVTALVVLAIPTFSMDLGLPGASSRATDDTSRQAYDITTDHFGPGFNGTLAVVAQDVTDPDAAQTVADRIGDLPGVASSTVSTTDNQVALITVVPTTGPNDPATTDLVNTIRDDRATLEQGTGSDILVGGTTAANIDTSTKLGEALPIFLIVVTVLAFVLLTFAFGSILVPIKSIIGFLLSAGAAFGCQVAVFQWGWLKDLFGIEPSQTLSFLPVILIAIIFGLSSDYEVFVVSRIKERVAAGRDAREAVIVGAGQSARVVTAAALIMAVVFASFMFTGDPITKAIGFSFFPGVVIDAFVVRLTLVPAVMSIIGAKLEEVGRQRTREANGDAPLITTWIPNTPADAERAGVTDVDVLNAVDYYRTPRGQHPNSVNRFRYVDTARLLAFDAFHLVDQLLTQPLQVIIGDQVGAFPSPAHGRDLFDRAAGEKTIDVIEGAGHYDLYDQPRYVTPAVDILDRFYAKHLDSAAEPVGGR